MNYQSEKINEHFIRIIDKTGVACYLVIGEEKACLLDTCNGFGNIKEYVEQLTDKPVFVLLTHGHHDHMGGANLFDEVYMNSKDQEVFKKFGNMDKRLNDAHQFHIEDDEVIPTRTQLIKEIENYQIFDLGNIHIQMIPVAGHTPGMMCPLIQEDRSIIFGDACGVSVLLFDEFSSSVSDYLKSLYKLKEFENQYDSVYRNHGTFTSPKDLLDNVIECCHLILSHQDDHVPVTLFDYQLYAAKATDGQKRLDGKEGNILYALEKAI